VGPPVQGKARHVVETGGFVHELVQMVTENVDAMREPKGHHANTWLVGLAVRKGLTLIGALLKRFSPEVAHRKDCDRVLQLSSSSIRSFLTVATRNGGTYRPSKAKPILTSGAEARAPRQMNGWEFVLVRPKRLCGLRIAS
jgi:hypothetical protein